MGQGQFSLSDITEPPAPKPGTGQFSLSDIQGKATTPNDLGAQQLSKFGLSAGPAGQAPVPAGLKRNPNEGSPESDAPQFVKDSYLAKFGMPAPASLGSAFRAPAQQISAGLKRIGNAQSPRDVAGGTSQAFRGALNAYSGPEVLGPAMLANPAATTAGLGFGSLAQSGTAAGLKAVGVAPEYADLAGDVAGAAAGAKAAKGAESLYDAASKAAGGLAHPFRVDPVRAIARAYNPTSSDPHFTDRLPETLSTVKAANGGVSPQTNEQVISGTRKAIDQHQAAFDQWMGRAAGVKISGDPVIAATRQAVGEMLPSEQQGAGQALIDRAQQDYGRAFTPQELKSRLELLNKRLRAFYNKSDAAQSSALADIPENVLVAQRNATADALYRALDPEGAGANPRALQSRIGDLIDLQDAALRRKNAVIAQRPASTAERAGRALKSLPMPNALRMGPSAPEILTSVPKNADALIYRAFQAVPGATNALPLPGEPYYPAPRTEPRALLNPSPLQSSTAGGVIVPDILGNTARGRTYPGPRLLDAAPSPRVPSGGRTIVTPQPGYAATDLNPPAGQPRGPMTSGPLPPKPGQPLAIFQMPSTRRLLTSPEILRPGEPIRMPGPGGNATDLAPDTPPLARAPQAPTGRPARIIDLKPSPGGRGRAPYGHPEIVYGSEPR